MKFKRFKKSDLNIADTLLIEAAASATNLSYSPYSKLNVGCALLLSDDQIIKGANIENSSYPLAMCAERTALYNLKINHPDKYIKTIAITAKHSSEDIFNTFISPCGACRQVLIEQEQNQNQTFNVILTSEDIDYVIKLDSWGDFLPLSFDKNLLIKE